MNLQLFVKFIFPKPPQRDIETSFWLPYISMLTMVGQNVRENCDLIICNKKGETTGHKKVEQRCMFQVKKKKNQTQRARKAGESERKLQKVR